MDHHAIPPSSSPRPADRTTADDISIDPPRAATAQVRIRPVVPGDADGLRALHTAGTSRCCPDRPAEPTRRRRPRSAPGSSGIAAFEQLTRDTAEVALLVADDHHEHGIGTHLMEHLAQAARNNGIHRFQADVLGENDLALRMVRDLGWPTQMRFHDGIGRVVADLAPDAATPPVGPHS